MTDTSPHEITGNGQETLPYEEFCRRVLALTGLDLAAYKRSQMERRLRTYAARRGAFSLEALRQLLVADPAELARFLDYLPITVTAFFRDGAPFHWLIAEALPDLLRHRETLTLWSAGCASGMEAYSLALALCALTPLPRYRILATDIHEPSLAAARQGVYGAAEIEGVPAPLRERAFLPEADGYRIIAGLREGIDFHRHDLLRDPYPAEVDLICCRNVVIYFSAEAKERLFSRLIEALAPGGYLVLGASERIIHARALGLTSPFPHVYRKAPVTATAAIPR